MISEILIVLAAGVLSAALRSYHHPVLFRLGTLGMVGTSFLAGWLIGGSVMLGLSFLAMWFLLPWVEILTRVRRMRLPLERKLETSAPPSRSSFPMLEELTAEVEEEGFEHVEDAAWSFEETRQFFRLFLRPSSKTSAAIWFVEQGGFAFYYLTLTSRTRDGRIFLTWNYPFSYGLRIPSKFLIQRASGDKSFWQLSAQHEDLLRREGVTTEHLRDEEASAVRGEMEAELREQIEHNLACGLLRREGPEHIRYSVRGMFFLWFQFLRDFVRIS